MSVILYLFKGRIINKRSSGSKLFFYDIRAGETKIQVMSSLSQYNPGIEDSEQVIGIINRLRSDQNPIQRYP